jgi:hypothetical protein
LASQLKVISMQKADIWLSRDRQNGWQLGWAK